MPSNILFLVISVVLNVETWELTFDGIKQTMFLPLDVCSVLPLDQYLLYSLLASQSDNRACCQKNWLGIRNLTLLVRFSFNLMGPLEYLQPNPCNLSNSSLQPSTFIMTPDRLHYDPTSSNSSIF